MKLMKTNDGQWGWKTSRDDKVRWFSKEQARQFGAVSYNVDIAEIDIAMKEMEANNHSVAEFGDVNLMYMYTERE